MAKSASTTIKIPAVKQETCTVSLSGTSGLWCHRMGSKAKHTLLIGGRRKTAAERSVLKHDPVNEFMDSMHIFEDRNEHTRIFFPAMALKSAMSTAALVVPGIYKTDVQRLVYLPDEWIPIYGVPQLRMSVTRSADARRTPDIRTRAFFPRWATDLTIKYVRPNLTKTAVLALLANAGIVCGIGDFRQEKGKGSYGTFKPVISIDRDLFDMDAQRAALEQPIIEDPETRVLMRQFDLEVENRM